MTKILDIHVDKVGNTGNETIAGEKTFSNLMKLSSGVSFDAGSNTLDAYEASIEQI